VNALIGAGLRIERLDEHRHLDWRFFSFMTERDDMYFLPDDLADKIPLQFSVLATKPA